MKLSSSNIKKFLIFPQKKAFLIFWETELFYILRNENPEKISYIFSKESFSYLSENENLPPQKKKKKKKKIFIFQEELPKSQKPKFPYQLLHIHCQLGKTARKVLLTL